MRIADPQKWAAHNGYQLRTSHLSKTLYAMASDNAVGILRLCDDGSYEFNAIQAHGSREVPIVNSDDRKPDLACASDMISHSFGLGFKPMELNTLSPHTNEIPLSGGVSGTGTSERISDCNYWLPYAAEHYHISRDIRDYVLVPVPAMFSDLPNTNGDSLSLGELLRFIPDYGMQMYKTFKGQPTHEEHQNKDITQAKGVILDCFLRPIAFNSRYYKVVQLLAFDRTKDPELVNQILLRQQNAYSVGFYYSSYACSICGNVVGKGINLTPCEHTQLRRGTYRIPDGRLAYRKCRNGKGFECSVVRTPAYVSNIGTHVMNVSQF